MGANLTRLVDSNLAGSLRQRGRRQPDSSIFPFQKPALPPSQPAITKVAFPFQKPALPPSQLAITKVAFPFQKPALPPSQLAITKVAFPFQKPALPLLPNLRDFPAESRATKEPIK